jgi:F-type H+-transporting ATPase subunit epsilon
MSMLRLEIVTPEGLTFAGDARMVVVPGVEGELGILPDHMPLMSEIVPGEVAVTTSGNEELRFAVGGGFLEVLPDRVSVMTDMAVSEADIDEKAVQEAIERAEREMREQALSDEDMATVQASLLRSLAKLHVKRRQHR